MIDVHVHMTYYWDGAPGTRPLGQPRRPAGVTTVLAADNARRTLETGVTTVRDLGASNEVDYAMRDLINMGKMVGPRMFVAGQGLSAGRDAPVDPERFASWPRRVSPRGPTGSRSSARAAATRASTRRKPSRSRR